MRVRVRKPQDMFETAESQNLASLSENAIQTATKTVSDKPAWTPEPELVTEQPQTTTTEVAEEPVETINFEDALKDMLKEFITNPEEEPKMEETKVSTSVGNTNGTAETIESRQKEENTHSESEDVEKLQEDGEKEQKEELNNDGEQTGEVKKSFQEEQEKQEEEPVKTVLPEVTTEIFTSEPTTIFQTVENAETTIEPEITTTSNEQTHKTRVLGTSTTTEISLETEICYRGRCVKTKKGDTNSDLLTME